jgi:hypothetical protein
MSTLINGSELRSIALGRYVTKSASPANATTSLFTVSGLVLITGIVGLVTTVMSGTATSINLNHDPTIGSAANLCGATVVTSDAAGTLYGYIGADITTLLVSSGTGAPSEAYTQLASVKTVLNSGVIGCVGTAANTGVVAWHLTYVPISEGASVVAA